jgi:hypothetical protein
MKRTLLLMMFAAAPLMAAGVAMGQAPPRPAAPAAPATGAGAAGAATAGAETAGAAAGEASPGAPFAGSGSTGPALSESQLEAQRIKIWESPAMKEARAYVEEYGRRSKQFSQADAEQYLAKLRQMSPTEMRQWLDRFAARQERNARAAAVAKAARQTAVEQAVSRLQAVQQSYDSFNQGQTEGANVARNQLATQQQLAGDMSAAKQADRLAILTQQFAGNPYRWIYMPPLVVQERAAASATPGDLPRGDPGNFLKGDAPIPGEAAAAFGLGGPAAVDAAAAGAGVPGGDGK